MKAISYFGILLFLFFGWMLHLSCKKEFSCETCNAKINIPPVAQAGHDTVITLPKDSVLLDGTGSSDPDGSIISYSWSKISGPGFITIQHSFDSLTVVNSLAAGSYSFELKVTDNGGLSARDTVMVTVDSVFTNNHPPIADAGTDQRINLPFSKVTVDGSGSTDPDNNIVSYLWTKISGPYAFNITSPNLVQTEISNLIYGTYQFELTVTDSGGLVGKDTMVVVVIAETAVNCGFLSKTRIGSLSIPRSSISIVHVGNKILFACGFEQGAGPPLYGASPRVDIYDVSSGNWTYADLSITRFHSGIIVAGDKVFFAGGNDGNPTSRVDIYDASSNTWTTAELSEARTTVIAVEAGNKVLFAGGLTNTGPSNKVDIYDQVDNTWSTARLSHPTAGSYPWKYEIERSGVVSVGYKIYFVFGDVYDAQSNTWSSLSNSLVPLSGAANVSSANQIFFSGYQSSTISPNYPNSLAIYDINSASWSSERMIQPRADMAAIAGDNKIFWAGGYDSTYILNGEEYLRGIDNIEVYDIKTASHTLHILPYEVIGVRAVKTNDKIFFSITNGRTEIYDMVTDSWWTCDMYFYQSIGVENAIYQLEIDNSAVWKLGY